jgi:hypothetical protein
VPQKESSHTMIRRRQIILALRYFLQRSRRVRRLNLKHTLALRRLHPSSRSDTFDAGWIDGELTSLAYDDLTLSVMYKHLLEYIHCVMIYATIYVSRTRKRSRDSRVSPLGAVFGSLCANLTSICTDIRRSQQRALYHFSEQKCVWSHRNDLLFRLVSISNRLLLGM